MFTLIRKEIVKLLAGTSRKKGGARTSTKFRKEEIEIYKKYRFLIQLLIVLLISLPFNPIIIEAITNSEKSDEGVQEEENNEAEQEALLTKTEVDEGTSEPEASKPEVEKEEVKPEEKSKADSGDQAKADIDGDEANAPKKDEATQDEKPNSEKESGKESDENKGPSNKSPPTEPDEEGDNNNLKESEEVIEEAEDLEHKPLEQYDNIPQQPKMDFPIPHSQMRTMNATEDPSVTHKIKGESSENICLRVVEGEVNFFLPAPEVKRPVDIIVVQDASGSYAGNETNARNSLKAIVEMLDFSPGQDRMMVTSYRGHKGWKYGDGRTYNDGSGVITKNHSGLINNAANLKGSINNITFDGGTPTASGLQFAKQQYETATQGETLDERERIFVLVTDGVANVRLDGRVHVTGNTRDERYQKYEGTFTEVESVASTIKAEYKLFSAYWENISSLRSTYGASYYDNTIGPAARAMVENTATSPNYFSTSQNITTVMQALLDNLQSTINQYSGFETTFTIEPGFELVANSVQLNGSNVSYTLSGNTVTITANSIPAGNNEITYKLKETSVHADVTTPITNGKIKYDKENKSFNESLDIPTATLAGNEYSDSCELSVNKWVAFADSADYKKTIELTETNEVFEYKLEYQIGADISQYSTVQLKDELESVLELVGTANDITVETATIQNLQYQINMLANQGGFTIDLEQRDGSFEYLAGSKITVYFKAKIKDGVTEEDLNIYRDKKIPNEASIVLNNHPTTSGEVYVKPPAKGNIKIIKVDEIDPTITLENATFEIKDTNDEVVDTITTDDQGEAISVYLPVGKYTIVEVNAPEGYEISENQNLEVTVLANETVEIKVTNKRLKGSISIIKIDAENSKPLEGATFQLVDENGNELEGTTNQDGEYVFDNLEWGKYTLKETKAPEGYSKRIKEIHITIDEENLHVTKQVKNTPIEWTLPKTGGIGAIGFYGLGLILMAGALWAFLRRRNAQ